MLLHVYVTVRGGATPPVNPVVAPCEDMLPYIPILIHHLWNVRKCVVTKRTQAPTQSREDVSEPFGSNGNVWWSWWRFGACVSVRGRQVKGTCAVSFPPREPPMGSPGLLENWLPCPNGWQSRGIDGAQLSPVIATAGPSKKEERGGVELPLGGWRVTAVGRRKKWGKSVWQYGCLCYLIIKDHFLCVFQQPEEDTPAWLQMTTTLFICHLCHYLPLSCAPPHNPPSCSLWLSEAARLAVAGQTEPSQVFLWGLVPFNQLLRRHTAAWKQRNGSFVMCGLLTVTVFWFSFSSVSPVSAVSCITMYGNKRWMTPCTLYHHQFFAI